MTSKQRFVSDPIQPLVETKDMDAMAAGEPGLPRKFSWRGRTLNIAAVLRTWRGTGPCKHGHPDIYVRKHWFEVETPSGRRARIYFDRRSRGRSRADRWWLFSIEDRK